MADESREEWYTRRAAIAAVAAVGVAAVAPTVSASTAPSRSVYLPECLNLDPRDLAFEDAF